MKKNIELIIILVLGLFLFAPKCFADSINVSASKSTVIVGNEVKVTIKLSSADALGSFKYTLTYDSNTFRFIGGDQALTYADVTKEKSVSYSYRFKAIKSGSGQFGIRAYSIRDYVTEKETNPNVNSITVKAITQAELEATNSTNANLKAFGVEGYEITPGFDKDTLEYSLTVPNEVEKVNISAIRADNTASINGAGEKELVEGNNKFEIVVTAQKGNTKTYVINIERKELDPIYVEIDKVTYSLVRKASLLPELTGFTPTTVTINETEIPALTSDITKYTVVGVKDNDGNILTYIYNDGKYSKYNEIQTKGIKIFIRNGNKAVLPDGYKACEITINDIKVNAYRLSDKSKQYLVYGVNVETGDEGLYVYDSELNSIINYDDEFTKKLDDKCEILLYCCILFGGLFAIIFIVFVIFIIKSSKKSKKVNKKDKKKNEEKEMID